MSPYYDRRGRSISPEQFVTLFADADYRRIAFDQLERCSVSTVWLGIDHNLGYSLSAPMIFETMVSLEPITEKNYRARDPISLALYEVSIRYPKTEELYRFTTEKKAKHFHKWIVQEVKER